MQTTLAYSMWVLRSRRDEDSGSSPLGNVVALTSVFYSTSLGLYCHS